ncbi:hypothetical protein Psta_1542 [Pirellula staleyi DSM 6068]|uniref:Lipoprotein n=1 Tax=Pirellula staleyi (strain ATCC 27377 / DSM 6068 / ICPB 4128) TaxID=530564 RepID=D2QXN2_PIRSD|nr:hypothetical protein [Pirellula staleyi]ADB16217.1 hypothetical protein Psta_1542 [Pirellula staleyi DSM 6068]
MKRLFLLASMAIIALGVSGCGCNRPFMSLFSRGDNCAPACEPGFGPRATTMYAPSAPQVLPGPIEVTPVN